MENKNTFIAIFGVVILLVLIYFALKKIGAVNRKGITSVDTGTPTTSISTATQSNTGTGTGTPLPPSNQITLTKVAPVYYLQLPKQTGYPHTPSDNAVANVTLPQGKTLTISKVWNFGGGQVFYETTEKVLYLSNPSQYGLGDYYLVKKSDL